MTRICVEYLLLDELSCPTSLSDRHRRLRKSEEHEVRSLLSYSSENWADHFRNANLELGDRVVSRARELCRVKSVPFHLWFPIFWSAFQPYCNQPDITDVMLISLNGSDLILRLILDAEAVDLKARDQTGRSVLVCAAEQGHEKVVQILLTKDTDVNTQGEDRNYALQAASIQGHEKIVRMLLTKGADVNGLDGRSSSALQAASIQGYDKIVQMLLDKGADVNTQGGHYGNTLQRASHGGHEKIVQMLLAKGADVNAQGGHYGGALQAASRRGHEKIVQMLLTEGADVNAQDRSYQAALCGGHSKIVQILLNKAGRGYLHSTKAKIMQTRPSVS